MSIFDNKKAFNFYRSYYETSLLLPKEDRAEFLEAIVNYQFTGQMVEPKRQMALLAFRGQLHSLKKQVIGYSAGLATYPNGNPTKGRHKGSDKGSHKQVQEKGKEKEEEKEKVQPTLSEVEDYFDSNGYTIQAANKFYNYYSVANWKDSKGKQVKNWKQKAQSVWFRDEYLKPKAGKLPNDFCV